MSALDSKVNNDQVRVFSEMADDFFVLSILAKVTPEYSSRALPWVFSHTIELSLKACCIQLGVVDFYGHNLPKIWGKIKIFFSDSDIWPKENHFSMYKDVFIRGDVQNKSLLGFPEIEELNKVEVAFWIDNVRDLKYGFDLRATMISTIWMSYPEMNPAFLKLFKGLRDKYKNPALDKRYIKKVTDLFPEQKQQEKCFEYLVR